MEPFDKVKQALIEYEKGAKAARDILSTGPRDYLLKRVEHYINALFDRFAPFKPGDRIEIFDASRIQNSTGWSGSKHFLIKGAQGVVDSIDYVGNLFVADVIFDEESYISWDGEVKPVEPHRKGLFRLSEKEVRKI